MPKLTPSDLRPAIREAWTEKFFAHRGTDHEVPFEIPVRRLSRIENLRSIDLSNSYSEHYGGIKDDSEPMVEYIFCEGEPILFTFQTAYAVVSLSIAQTAQTEEERYAWQELLILAAKEGKDGVGDLIQQFGDAATRVMPKMPVKSQDDLEKKASQKSQATFLEASPIGLSEEMPLPAP